MSRKIAPQFNPYPPEEEGTTMDHYNMAPHEVQAEDRFSLKFVAVVDYAGRFWKAYKSFGGYSDGFVAGHGDVIGEELARQLFPLLGRREDMRYG